MIKGLLGKSRETLTARTMSFRMIAVKATLGGLPMAISVLYLAAGPGLNRAQ